MIYIIIIQILYFHQQDLPCHFLYSTDMEKGADTQTLSAEIFDNRGNFWILEEYLILFWNKTYKL